MHYLEELVSQDPRFNKDMKTLKFSLERQTDPAVSAVIFKLLKTLFESFRLPYTAFAVNTVRQKQTQTQTGKPITL